MLTIYRRRLIHICILALALVGLLWLELGHSTPVRAGGVVSTCDEPSLRSALAGGGSVTFNCPGSPIINLNSQIVITANTAVDGSNGGVTVRLAGARIFSVTESANLALTKLILLGSALVNADGGCVYANGKLLLDDVEMSQCQVSAGNRGGALYVDGAGSATLVNSSVHDNFADWAGGGVFSLGALTLTNSYFANNSVPSIAGGAVWARSSAYIENSTFYSNSGGLWGGGIYSEGNLSVTKSSLSANHAQLSGGGIYVSNSVTTATLNDSIVTGNSSDSGGGGIFNAGQGLIVTQTTISDNRATFAGNGIDNVGTIMLVNSSLRHNTRGGYGGGGGGIYNGGTAVMLQVTLSDNESLGGGGIFNIQTMTLTNVTLAHNEAETGGGISNQGTLIVNNSTLSNNLGRVWGGALFNFGTANFVNSTLSGNSALGGGGIYNASNATLWNVTLSNNSAGSSGGALWMSGYTVLTNSILAYSPVGGNCSGTISAYTSTLSSDNTCALTGSIKGMNPNGLDPLLTGLGNYGGPTQVHMLRMDSPARDGVIGNNAPSIDQRGFPRPQFGGFDIGAVERQPSDVDFSPRVYLPLILP